MQWPRWRWMDRSFARSLGPNIPAALSMSDNGRPARLSACPPAVCLGGERACVGGPKRGRRMQRKEAREDGERHDDGRGRRSLNGRETDSIADSLEVILDITAGGTALFDLSFSHLLSSFFLFLLLRVPTWHLAVLNTGQELREAIACASRDSRNSTLLNYSSADIHPPMHCGR